MKKIAMLLGWLLAASLVAADLPPLIPRGDDFVTPDGVPVRLWGVNLSAFYPDHALAQKTAQNLRSLNINCVRPHHLLRPSKDWNWSMTGGALSDYVKDSQTPDPEAWDRFLYLCSELRQNGIYLMLSLGDTRTYLPGDWQVWDNGPADNEAWQKSIDELNCRDWRDAIDVRKGLPLVDERAARVMERYIKQLLTAPNPYSKTTFAADSQVVTVELLNEFSLEYLIVCKNRFPEYQEKILLAEWRKFAGEHNVDPGDFYEPKNELQIETRGRFSHSLEQRFFDRMSKVVRATGYRGSIIYSNLFEGENALRFNAVNNGSMEDHAYVDPRLYLKPADFVLEKSQSKIDGKPLIIGECNVSEYADDIRDIRLKRAMLPLAAAAYGSLQNWSGVVWFAWCHGGNAIAPDGWAKQESVGVDNVGSMVSDRIMLDQMRTSSLIFRRNMVQKSAAVQIFALDDLTFAADYHRLMANPTPWAAPVQSVRRIAKSFAGKSTPSAAINAINPVVSDTGEIEKNTDKKYLKIVAPQVNAFGGDGSGEMVLPHLSFVIEPGQFAVVAMVSLDGKKLAESRHLVISKTVTDNDGQLQQTGHLVLKNLTPATWSCQVTRPRAASGKTVGLVGQSNGDKLLPLADWSEVELLAK